MMGHDECATVERLFEFLINIRPALDVALKDFLSCDQPVFTGVSWVGSKDAVEVHYLPRNQREGFGSSLLWRDVIIVADRNRKIRPQCRADEAAIVENAGLIFK